MTRIYFVVLFLAALLLPHTADAKSRVGVDLGGFTSSKAVFQGVKVTEVSAVSFGKGALVVAGYELNESFEVGLTYSFEFKTTENAAGAEVDEDNSVYLAYMNYNITPGEKVVYFAGPRMGFGTSVFSTSGGSVEGTSTYFIAAGGLKYFYTTDLSLDATALYGIGTMEYEGTDLDLTVMALTVGFSVWL